jgi:hypothetical protein
VILELTDADLHFHRFPGRAAIRGRKRANRRFHSDSSPKNEAPSSTPAALPSGSLLILWLGLAACASALFLGTTNQLCKNVAAVPLLRVLPLAIYLLTFTLCFESDHRYSRKWLHPAFALAVFLAVFVLSSGARAKHAVKIQVIQKRRWTDDYSNLFQTLAAPSVSR